MRLKKLFALALAALMLLSLWACGKSSDEYKSGIDATKPQVTLLPDEAGKLTIYGEADLQVIYNEVGNVLAVNALNKQAEDIANTYDFAEKASPLVVLELIDQIYGHNLIITKGFVLVRQEPGSATPSDDFLKNILEDAQLNKAGYAVIVTGADELDKDGLFSKETALAVLKASQLAVEGTTMDCAPETVGGSYTVVCTDAAGNTTQYSIGAVDGSITLMENSNQAEPEEPFEEETIPESDIFDPIPDTEANKGTDGGVDNGSVDFS